MFRVRVAESYHIIEPYKTERNIPFYFHATEIQKNLLQKCISQMLSFPFVHGFKKLGYVKRMEMVCHLFFLL